MVVGIEVSGKDDNDIVLVVVVVVALGLVS